MLARGVAALLLLLGVLWLLDRSVPPPAPKFTTEELLDQGRSLFDAWQDQHARKAVTLDAVASVMRALEAVPTTDKHYATGRQAIEVLRPIRETLADEEIERQRIETEKRLKEIRAAELEARNRIAGDASGRKAYANELEHRYLKRGMDVTVSVEGDRNTTLRLRWVLISRPIVYNFINDRDLMADLKGRGFRQLVMTDGYDSTWRQKID